MSEGDIGGEWYSEFERERELPECACAEVEESEETPK